MSRSLLFLLIPLLTFIAIDVAAQAVEFPANLVKLQSTANGITLDGLRTPEGTIPRLILRSTVPAMTEETVLVVGGDRVDRPVSVPSVRSFVGRIEGDDKSSVALTYVGDRAFGLIQESDGTTWVLTRDLQKETYSVTNSSDRFSVPDCGFRDEGSIGDQKSTSVKAAASGLRELELAVETDSEFFKNTGGDEQKAVDYLAALMSSVSSLYQQELGIVIKVVWARVWTDNPRDPYNVAGNPFALSDSVRANWSAYDTVHRDLLHVMTASGSGGGGFAYLDAICRTESHAHGATSLQGWTDLSAPGFNYDIYIVSHEIGHNFNARHTHSCYYGAPLDTCEVDQGIAEGCLEPGQQKVPDPGSIMSYCGWTNLNAGLGYTIEMTFRDTVRSAMKSYSETLECLSEVPLPLPVAISPRGDSLPEGPVAFQWSTGWTVTSEWELAGAIEASTTTEGTSHSIDLTEGAYQWRVRSVSSTDQSAWTEWTPFYVVKEFAMPTVSIVEPDGDTVGSGSIELVWSAQWSGSYDLEVRGDKTLTEVVTGSSYFIDLVAGTYEWRIRATSDDADGPWSGWASVVVSDDITDVRCLKESAERLHLW